jgi:uncharacterized HAD superfamily protein
MSRRIAVDCDGVLFDFNSRFIELCNKAFNVNIPPVSHHYPDEWHYPLKHISKKQYRQAWDEICNSQSYNFWRFLPAFEWSRDFLLQAQQSASLVFITSRCGKHCQRATEDALLILGASNPHVVIAGKKAPVVKAEKCTDFLDDKPENHDEVAAANEDCNQWLLDGPWNRHYQHPRVERITDPRDMLSDKFVENDALGG